MTAAILEMPAGRLTKSEQAAKMRLAGRSVEAIAAHFGWSKKTARELISRGKKYPQFRAHHAEYIRKAGVR